VLIGVVPERVAKGVGLTPRVRESVPAVVADVIERLRALGFPPTPRPGPASVPWWERPVGDRIGSSA
jgi:hypothetical protein